MKPEEAQMGLGKFWDRFGCKATWAKEAKMGVGKILAEVGMKPNQAQMGQDGRRSRIGCKGSKETNY